MSAILISYVNGESLSAVSTVDAMAQAVCVSVSWWDGNVEKDDELKPEVVLDNTKHQ